MYGTLVTKGSQESGPSSGENDSKKSSTGEEQLAGLSAQQLRLQQQENRRRKRIYSHCHVQADGSTLSKSLVDRSARRRLVIASAICLIFMICEIVGGILSNSLAIATDAAHLLTDFASFMISLLAMWLSSRPASKRMSFGWYRAEVIGALLSVLMIWLVTGLLVYIAVERLKTGEFELDSTVMVITASAGLAVNIIMAIALHFDGGHGHGHGHHHHNHHHHHHEEACERDNIDTVAAHLPPLVNVSDSNNMKGDAILLNGSSNKRRSNSSNASSPTSSNHSHTSIIKPEIHGRGRSNINVRAAFIHVIGDFLQSLGVLIAALVIYFGGEEYAIVDPICTFIFSLIVLITTVKIIGDAINVLMEGIPEGINFIEVREKLQGLPSVIRVHNLRIWSLSLDKIAISTHLVIDDTKTPSQALKMAIETLKSSYNFFEVTIQVEEFKEDMKDCEHCQDEEVVINVVEKHDTTNGSH